jgi:hypothetical protein
MFAVPGLTPETAPVAVFTVATEGVPDDHAPPGDASVNVAETPRQVVPEPATAAGGALTVTMRVMLQPIPSV